MFFFYNLSCTGVCLSVCFAVPNKVLLNIMIGIQQAFLLTQLLQAMSDSLPCQRKE